MVGSECTHVATSTPTAASRRPAQPRVQPGCPSAVSAPLPVGAPWAAIPEGAGLWAIARAAGFPGGPAAAPRPSPLGCGPRPSGAVEWRQAYVGSWGNWLPAAGPGRLNVAVKLAVGGLSTLGSPGDPSVGVCLYRKQLTDSSSWMRGLTC
jgi:hypothetical protein